MPLPRSRRQFLRTVATATAGMATTPLLAACGNGSGGAATVSSTATSAVTPSSRTTASSSVRAATTSAASTTSATAELAPTPAPTVAPAKGAVVVTWGGEDNPYVAAGHEAEVDAYNKQQAAIHVDYVPITNILGAVPDKLQAMIAGGAAPDLFELGSAYYASAVRKDLLLDITSYVDRSQTFDKADFFPVVWNAFLYQQHVYTIPREGAPTIMYYNLDLFQKAGLKPPPMALKDADWWTTEAFLDTATKLTQKSGGGTSVYGYYSPESNWWPFLMSFGGNVLDQTNSTCTLNSDASIAAFQWLQDTIAKQQVAPTPEVLDKTAANKVFENSGVAMILTRRSQNGEYAKTIKGFTWKLGPFPKGPAGRHSDMISNSVSVSAQTKHPTEAFEAASFMESTQGHLIRMQYAEQIGVPQRKSVVESPQFLNNVLSPAENQLVVDQIADAIFQPPLIPQWSQVSSAYGPALTSIWQNKANVRDALGSVVGPINALLKG